MQINFTGLHVDVTPALQQFTRDKFAKLGHCFEHIQSIHVIFEVEKLRHTVKATLNIPHEQIAAHAQADDMYIAIDEIVHKLYNQLNKHKEKMLDHRHERDHRDHGPQ